MAEGYEYLYVFGINRSCRTIFLLRHEQSSKKMDEYIPPTGDFSAVNGVCVRLCFIFYISFLFLTTAVYVRRT